MEHNSKKQNEPAATEQPNLFAQQDERNTIQPEPTAQTVDSTSLESADSSASNASDKTSKSTSETSSSKSSDSSNDKKTEVKHVEIKGAPKLTLEQYKTIILHFIHKTKRNELLLLKALDDAPERISLDKFDDVTIAALNDYLNTGADKANITSELELGFYRVENAEKLSMKFGEGMPSNLQGKLRHLLGIAAKSAQHTIQSFAALKKKK